MKLIIILEICQKQPFDIIAMTPRGTLGLCCVHISQLITHPAVYKILFALQLCYKPLSILQRVSKSQKIYISSHVYYNNFIKSKYQVKIYYKNFITSSLLNIGADALSERGQRNRNFLPSPLTCLETMKNLFPGV